MNTGVDTSGDGFRLWLTTEMYVPLDKQGYVSADVPCLEGSMGYVIQAVNRDDPNVRYAWKIPRLLGDSLTENQYVCQLLLAEERHAIRMQNSPGVLAGLGPAGNPFERPLPGMCTPSAPPARGVVARHYLLVQFGKGKRPRFCTVTFDGASISVHPNPTFVNMDRRPSLGGELRNALETRVYAQYIHEHRETGFTDIHIAALIDVSDSEQTKGGWYLKLPSVLYNWAGGTLQEVISEGRRSNWTVRENLILVQRILTGIRELHSKRLLHGDMRPANIMYIRDPTDPEDYVLTDYGSLAGGDADRFAGSGEEATSDRTLFQAITNPRSSQFYAPERRQGYEHEEGDVVLLVPVLSNGLKSPAEVLRTPDLRGWLLVVGWRNAIDGLKWSPPVEPDAAYPQHRGAKARSGPSNVITPRAVSEADRRPAAPEDVSRVEFEQSALGVLLRSLAERFAGTTQPPSAKLPGEREMRLQPGDRVRFREYVFRVRSIEEREVRTVSTDTHCSSTKLTLMYCDPEFWRVFTERLIIVVTDPGREFPFKGRSFEELSFPKMVELYRWSQATDIFAVGALALYSLFPRRTQRSSRDLEQEFASLLEILENPLFFRKIWPDLAATCNKLRETLGVERRERRAPSEFARVPVRIPQVSRSPSAAGNARMHEEKTIKDLVRDTATSLALTAPHAYDLFRETFSGNAALFCLFMRFVLACLHRRTSCAKDWDTKQIDAPYCTDRIESTSVQIAAEKALADVRGLLPLLNDERLQCLTLSEEECRQMPQFVDQGRTHTIMQNLQLLRDLGEKDQECREWQEKLRALEAQVREVKENVRVDGDLAQSQVSHLIENARKTLEILDKSRRTLADASCWRIEGLIVWPTVRRQAIDLVSSVSKVCNEIEEEATRLRELIRRASM